MPKHEWALGIDLGGTRLKAVAASPTGRLLDEGEVESASDQPQAWVAAMNTLEERFRSGLGGAPCARGLAAPGIPAPDERSIAHMPGRLRGLEGLDWTQTLASGAPLWVLNDAHAALLAEAWTGAAQGVRDALLLTLGTGVGGAALVNGRLHRGHTGRAGHLGHLCLDLDASSGITGIPGSLEEEFGEASLPRRSAGAFSTTRELLSAMEAGDEAATSIWKRAVRALGCSIASLINAFDPELVILGGGVSAAGPVLLEPLRAVLDEVEWRPRGSGVPVVPARLGAIAGALGAARRALEGTLPQPAEPSQETLP